MEQVGAVEQDRARLDPAAGQLGGTGGGAGGQPDRRAHPQRLGGDARGVVQVADRLAQRLPAGRQRVQLGVEPGLDVGGLGDQVEGGGHGVGGGLAAAQVHGHDLVVDLLVRERRPGLRIAGVDQQGEQVALVAAARVVVRDRAVDDLVHVGQGLLVGPVVRGGQALGQAGRGDHAPVDAVHDHRQALLHTVDRGLARELAEHGAGDDPQRQRLHPLPHVDDLAGTPTRGLRLELLDHDVRVAGHLRGVEGGLEHPTLAAVVRVAGGDQAVAGESAGGVEERTALVEGARVLEQVADHVRVGGQIGPLGSDPDLQQVALPGQGAQERQWVPPEAPDVPEHGNRPRRGPDDVGPLGHVGAAAADRFRTGAVHAGRGLNGGGRCHRFSWAGRRGADPVGRGADGVRSCGGGDARWGRAVGTRSRMRARNAGRREPHQDGADSTSSTATVQVKPTPTPMVTILSPALSRPASARWLRPSSWSAPPQWPMFWPQS